MAPDGRFIILYFSTNDRVNRRGSPRRFDAVVLPSGHLAV
jgi:hypothetical protein